MSILTTLLWVIALTSCVATSAWTQTMPEGWIATYNSEVNRGDEGQFVATDAAGNIIVAGASIGSTTYDNTDIVITKFAPSGTFLWARRYDGTALNVDSPMGLAVDVSGNIIVTGLTSSDRSGRFDFVTLKFDPSGNQQWVRTYYRTSNSDDYPGGIAVDASGNVYVAGYSVSETTAPVKWVLLKYGSDGNLDWERFYDYRINGAGNNVFGAAFDDTTQRFFVLARAASVHDFIVAYHADGTFDRLLRDWAEVPVNIMEMRSDGRGSLYIVGAPDCYSCPNDGMLTEKIDLVGSQSWLRSFDGSLLQSNASWGSSVGFDPIGNVYAVGAVMIETRLALLTLKYDAEGRLLWYRKLATGDRLQIGQKVSVSPSGNVFLAANVYNTASDALLVKYDTDGVLRWTFQYNGIARDADMVHAVAADAFGNAFFAGMTRVNPVPDRAPPGNYADMFLIKNNGGPYVTGGNTGGQNNAPTSHITSASSVECIGESTTTTLSGSLSSDPDNDPLTFTWTGPFGTTTGETTTVSLPLGTHNITLTVDDGRGGTDTQTLSLTVGDSVAPVITAGDSPVMLEATSPSGATYSINATASDACGGAVPVSYDPASVMFPLGMTAVTVRAQDMSGNAAAKTVNITVRDTTAPIINNTSDITAEATASCTVLDLGTITATDAVDTSLTVSNDAPICFALGNTLVYYTAEDDFGNRTTAARNVSVVDTTPPELTLPADITAVATGNRTNVNFGNAAANDLFGPVIVSHDAPSNGFPVGVTVVTWVATDANARTATGQQQITVTNGKPVAHPGNDVSIHIGQTVQLDGSQSFDPDQHPIVYNWSLLSKPAGSQTALSSSTFVNPTFQVDKLGAYEVELVVVDSTGEASLPTRFTVRAVNTAPNAIAEIAGVALAGVPVDLIGSASNDPDSDALVSYEWLIVEQPPGSQVVFADSTAVNPIFTPTHTGLYQVQLRVADEYGAMSGPALLAIEVNLNSPPIAAAGADVSLKQRNIGTRVLLDGTQSFDPEGHTPLSYSWRFVTWPAGSSYSLDQDTTANSSFVADVYGDYELELTVTDKYGAVSQPDAVRVSFTNVPPVCSAGGNQSVDVNSVVTLDGSASSDTDQDSLTFSWNLVTAPVANNAVVGNSTTPIATLKPNVAGSYVLGLAVNDGRETSGCNVTVQVSATAMGVVAKLQDAVTLINTLDPSAFNNANNVNALTNKLQSVIALVESGDYVQAISKLENDVLKKTDGCVSQNQPDKNDWIIRCDAQETVFNAIVVMLRELRSL